MYSNSNSFLGGNSQRPGAPQYGGSFNSLGSGQQQPSPFAPQPTGFGQQQPLQQQYTGFPMGGQQQQQQPLQQQFTGFPGQQQQGGPSAVPPMPSMPQQYQQQFQQQQQQQQQPQQPQQPPQQSFQTQQQTGFSSSPQPSSGPSQPPAAIKPQPTGFSQMAASFQTGGTPKPQGRRQEKTNKIPNIRLSFITATDQTRFETLFKSAVGDETAMSGEKARDLLMRSKLDGDSLSHIWYVSMQVRSGKLCPEC
jgi:hypothetical protein